MASKKGRLTLTVNLENIPVPIMNIMPLNKKKKKRKCDWIAGIMPVDRIMVCSLGTIHISITHEHCADQIYNK